MRASCSISPPAVLIAESLTLEGPYKPSKAVLLGSLHQLRVHPLPHLIPQITLDFLFSPTPTPDTSQKSTATIAHYASIHVCDSHHHSHYLPK
jgi:hypothetical protein